MIEVVQAVEAKLPTDAPAYRGSAAGRTPPFFVLTFGATGYDVEPVAPAGDREGELRVTCTAQNADISSAMAIDVEQALVGPNRVGALSAPGWHIQLRHIETRETDVDETVTLATGHPAFTHIRFRYHAQRI